MVTLDVRSGDLRLVGEKEKVALKLVGPGPLFRLTDGESGGDKYTANLLFLGEEKIWIFPSTESGGVRLSRMQPVPANLHGRWNLVLVPGEDEKPVTLEITATGLTVTEGKRQPGNASLAWLQGGGDDYGSLIAVHEGEALRLTMGEKGPLAGLLVQEKGAYLATKDKPVEAMKLPVAGLQGRQVIYLDREGQAFDLRCKDKGCELVPLDLPKNPVPLKVVPQDTPGPMVRLRSGPAASDNGNEINLGVFNDKVMVLGRQRRSDDRGLASNLALSPLSMAKAPKKLRGNWKTSVVFPAQSFDITEVRIGDGGVETSHQFGKPNQAFLVQSAFDNGVLLLARGPRWEGQKDPSQAGWALWRLTQVGEGWYLSRWNDGTGLVALHHGVEPPGSPLAEVKQALADFCDLAQHHKRVAQWPEAYAQEPRVAIKGFAEDANGRQRFVQVGIRRFFEALIDVSAQQMSNMLPKVLADYNLPAMKCPALDEIAARQQAANESRAAASGKAVEPVESPQE